MRNLYVKVGILALLLLYTLTGCYLLPKEEEILAPPLVRPAVATYSLFDVIRDDIERTIKGTAVFIYIQENDIYMSRNGRVQAIYIKQGDTVKKGQLLIELENDGLIHQVETQRLNVNKIRLQYERTKSSQADSYTIEIAAIDLKLAEMRLKQLEDEWDQAKLVSPYDGVIVSVSPTLAVGSNVSSNQSLFKIADPDRIQLSYTGSNADLFRQGMIVQVDNIEGSNKTHIGTVLLAPSNMPANTEARFRNMVLIDVEDKPEDIVNTSASISILLQRKENVIVIPKGLVKTYTGRRFVHVLEDGLRLERNIETGIETSTHVEIISGLQEGDQIIRN